jgi:hypothetical protein
MPSVSVTELVASVHFSPGITLVPRKAPIAGCFVPDAKPFPQSRPPFFSLIRRCSLFRAAKRVRDPAVRCKPSKSAIITRSHVTRRRTSAPTVATAPLTGQRRSRQRRSICEKSNIPFWISQKEACDADARAGGLGPPRIRRQADVTVSGLPHHRADGGPAVPRPPPAPPARRTGSESSYMCRWRHAAGRRRPDRPPGPVPATTGRHRG